MGKLEGLGQVQPPAELVRTGQRLICEALEFARLAYELIEKVKAFDDEIEESRPKEMTDDDEIAGWGFAVGWDEIFTNMLAVQTSLGRHTASNAVEGPPSFDALTAKSNAFLDPAPRADGAALAAEFERVLELVERAKAADLVYFDDFVARDVNEDWTNAQCDELRARHGLDVMEAAMTKVIVRMFEVGHTESVNAFTKLEDDTPFGERNEALRPA